MVNDLITPFYGWPSWLSNWITAPPPLMHLLYKHTRGTMPHPTPGGVIFYVLAAIGLLLAALTAVAVTASRRVLLPVRRLAQAAQRMSDGDLSVRVEPKGRDELAQLTTTFNDMAAALESKIGELERMEARARQFAGDVSHELRTPLTAMTAVAPRSARAACVHLLPKYGLTLTPAQQELHQRQQLAFAACMRRHGFPQFPDGWSGNVGQLISAGIDPNSPQLNAALTKCGF